MNRYLPLAFLLLYLGCKAPAQDKEGVFIKKIYDEALTDHTAHGLLRSLTREIPGRISGTAAAAKAVEWGINTLRQLGFDSVYTQAFMVKHWERGGKEKAEIISSLYGKEEIAATALGLSVGTGPEGIRGQVIEVDSLSKLAVLGRAKLAGKIIFFNRPADPTLFRPGQAYGGASDQRTRGASEAAMFGAIGVIVRSLTIARDGYPHTGQMKYDSAYPFIPAIAISTHDADLLSGRLKSDPSLEVHFTTFCQNLPEVESYNVIGEIRGREQPGEVILTGGHLDAWDIGEGAHDDGAGCIHSIEALRILKKLGYQPRHTIRCVLFMDEEIAQRGGRAYAAITGKKKEKHRAAIESDSGGFPPTGISIDASPEMIAKLKAFQKYFNDKGIYFWEKGGSGVDIGFLKESCPILIGMRNDSQRYFDYHHSAADTFETVHEREMQLGSAFMASLVFLLDICDL